MGQFTYSAGDHDEDSRFDVPPPSTYWRGQWEDGASELATDYYNNHDGWESAWPLEFRVYEDSKQVARFLVEMEMEPVFYARNAP